MQLRTPPGGQRELEMPTPAAMFDEIFTRVLMEVERPRGGERDFIMAMGPFVSNPL